MDEEDVNEEDVSKDVHEEGVVNDECAATSWPTNLAKSSRPRTS